MESLISSLQEPHQFRMIASAQMINMQAATLMNRTDRLESPPDDTTFYPLLSNVERTTKTHASEMLTSHTSGATDLRSGATALPI